MTRCLFVDSQQTELNVMIEPTSSDRQLDRIAAALGLPGGPLPEVDDDTLCQYYAFLSAKLMFPFTAYYARPDSTCKNTQSRCTVLELLDPSQYVGDIFDGIFCRTRSGEYGINLPLIDLEVADDGPNFHLIEDFWYWFWNWR